MDRKRLEHILVSARDAQAIVGELKDAELAADMVRTRALVNCFTEIGEAANRVSEPTKTLVKGVPWRKIVGMRNIVVHVYWGIDVGTLAKTTRTDLGPLIEAVKAGIAMIDSIEDR